MTTIHHHVSINASAAAVFEAIATPEGISRWWDKQTAVQTDRGVVLEHDPGPEHGVVKLRVVESAPDRRVEWECISTHPKSSPASAWTGTRFSFDLTERGDVTSLDFRQSGYDERSEFFGPNNLAWEALMRHLKEVVEALNQGIDERKLDTYNPREPKPGPAHQKLSVLAGRWRFAGRNLKGAPIKPGSAVSGESVFEWFPGDFFLAGRETVTFDGQQHITMMVFSYDDQRASHFVRFYDNGGFSRVYAVTIEGRVWRLSGKLERARIEFSDDGKTARYYWERTEDEGQSWMALCEFTSTKTD